MAKLVVTRKLIIDQTINERSDSNQTELNCMIMSIRVSALICLLFVGAAGQELPPLPEFSLPTLKGQTVTSQELKDNIVVLDFWATWCEGCITEIPAFNRLAREYGPRGVKVIGLAVQSGWAKDIRKFAKRYKMRYTLLVGNDDTVSEFGVISFPATYVIAPGWKLHKKYLGVSETKAADIQRDIEALLKARNAAQSGGVR